MTTDGATQDRVLLAGLPKRHLDAAVDVCRANGRVAVPAGRPGDLDEATPGSAVLLMISGQDAVPAVTWRATFVRRVFPKGGELPALLPASWLDDRRASAAGDASEDGDNEGGPQSFFEVERLEPLPKHEWIFANELVRKQERGGRAFFPRSPRLIDPPG